MTVRRGGDWGQRGGLPPDGVVVGSDAEARHLVEAARRAQRDLPVIGLTGGDLWATLGGSGRHSTGLTDDAVTATVDVGSVLIDGRIHWFVAHLVARHRWWRGRALVAMNAQWLGSWDLGPQAHPGDGLIDVSDGALPWRQRLIARRRVRTGTHLPHPAITTCRVGAFQTTFDSPIEVWLDGEQVGRASTLSVRIEPEALTVVV